jgi:thioester reductase-like protein
MSKALEEPVLDPQVSLGNGYSESKWVSENIVLRAAKAVSQLQTTIVRPGQVSGAPNGAWDINHWVSSIIVSGPVVKCLPMLDGVSRRFRFWCLPCLG